MIIQAGNNASHLNLVQETDKGKTEMAFQLHNLELESMDIPEMNYAAKITMSSARLSKLVKDFKALDDTIRIRAARDKAILSITGTEGEIQMNLRHNEGDIADRLSKTQIMAVDGVMVDQQFALGYLDLFAKASSLCTFTTIGLLPEQPVMVEFPIAGFGELRYFLAPKLPD